MIERLKTICILILLIAGITQVGILWNYQSQGTPTGLFYGLIGISKAPQVSDDMLREKLFLPDRLILSDGSSSYWIVGDNVKSYSALWDETKQGLSQIFYGDAKMNKVSENWAEVAAKRGILIDFGFTMSTDLLSWFLGIVNPSHELADVRKLLINRDITDETVSIFYVLGNDGTVYKSSLIRYDEAVKLEEIIRSVSQISRGYTSLGGSNLKKENDAPDVLYAVAPKYWRYSSFSVKSPVKVSDDDDLASIILGFEKDRYNMSKMSGNIIQFNYGDNVYRYYEDDYMTYRYLENAYTSGKGQVGKALLNTYQFISDIYDDMQMTADIALTSVEELSSGVYHFGFDYKVAGMPVKIDIETKDGNGSRLLHAIDVQADTKRVLKCDWLLKGFDNITINNYDDRFNILLASLEMSFSEINIQDIYSCYFIDSPSVELLKPSLLIRTKGRGDIPIKMIPEEGG